MTFYSPRSWYYQVGSQLVNQDRQSGPTPTHITKLSNHTFFTYDEIVTWHRGFMKTCPTGKLSLREFVNIYKEFFPDGEPQNFAEWVFRAFDTKNQETFHKN